MFKIIFFDESFDFDSAKSKSKEIKNSKIKFQDRLQNRIKIEAESKDQIFQIFKAGNPEIEEIEEILDLIK